MYPNFIEDRKSLGYVALIDSSCGMELVQMTQPTFLFLKNVSLNSIFIFQLGQPLAPYAYAVMLPLPPDVYDGPYNQRLEEYSSYKKTEPDDESINPIQVKTGSGAVIEIQNQQNQPSEALKSALEIRSGDLGKGSSPGSRAKVDGRRNA